MTGAGEPEGKPEQRDGQENGKGGVPNPFERHDDASGKEDPEPCSEGSDRFAGDFFGHVEEREDYECGTKNVEGDGEEKGRESRRSGDGKDS